MVPAGDPGLTGDGDSGLDPPTPPNLPSAIVSADSSGDELDRVMDSAGLPPVAEILRGLRTETPSLSLRERLTRQGSAMRILWKSGAERAESLIFQFAQRGVPQQFTRWTGWYGNIGEHENQLPTVASSFLGLKGFHVFGGTQIHDLDTGKVRATIGEVPVALKKADSDIVLVGVIPKVEEEPMYIPEVGIVLTVEPEYGHFTVINQDQNIGIVLQPDVNGTYKWSDEADESLRQAGKLMQKGWAANLVLFGGSPTKEGARKKSTCEQELLNWARMAQEHDEFNANIILLRGSGGVADQYAGNQEWLEKNPAVKVFDISKESIQTGLSGLGLECNWGD